MTFTLTAPETLRGLTTNDEARALIPAFSRFMEDAALEAGKIALEREGGVYLTWHYVHAAVCDVIKFMFVDVIAKDGIRRTCRMMDKNVWRPRAYVRNYTSCNRGRDVQVIVRADGKVNLDTLVEVIDVLARGRKADDEWKAAQAAREAERAREAEAEAAARTVREAAHADMMAGVELPDGWTTEPCNAPGMVLLNGPFPARLSNVKVPVANIAAVIEAHRALVEAIEKE